jgi:hypothetical protein
MSGDIRFGNVGGPVNTGNPVNQGGNQVVGLGDIIVSGGNQNGYGLDPGVLQAIGELRAGLDGLRLTGAERTAAEEDLSRVEQAGDDAPAAADAFQSFLDRLGKAGALADAGTVFVAAVRQVVRWLGPLAAGAALLL